MHSVNFAEPQTSNNCEGTEALGRLVAQELKPGQILSLVGDLGAGKTTFARGVIAGLGGDPSQVSSPTFSLVHEYDSAWGTILHCDFYRLKGVEDFEALGGWEIFFARPLVIVEWIDRLGDPPKRFNNQMVAMDFSITEAGRMLRWKNYCVEKK